MRIAIIQFPGSNCERETILAVRRAGMQPVEFLWNEPKEKLAACDGFILVGGFSYEDRSRAGIIAALDPIIDVLKQQNAFGKPILGICNGAQILVETGLVPGIENDKVGMVLTDNKRIQNGKLLGTGFYNAWVNMRLSDNYQLNAFTRKLTKKQILKIPVAHGEGRFVIPPALLAEMENQGMLVFQYCNDKGEVVDEFPINPNGSVANVAAVSNKKGNVLAMMPHPERTENGDAIFQSMKEYIEQGFTQKIAPLFYYPRPVEIKKINSNKNHFTLTVELIITDNQALSVQNALKHKKINVNVKRYTFWEIECDNEETFEKIKQSGVLFNDRKEKLIEVKNNFETFLVRPKENIIGQQKKQMLKDHFDINGIQSIYHNTLWQIDADETQLTHIINSHILFNPYAHECYYY